VFYKRIHLFNLLGFRIWIDFSWLIIAVLITWSLANTFPQYYPDLSTTSRWSMGVAGIVGLFASIVLHELSHSLVARHYGVPMKGITLFIFGGVAEMEREPANPKAKFLMAIAGPIASLFIALACFGSYLLAQAVGWPVEIQGVAGYLAWLNSALAVFNLVPAFPLDGGRVLRSALWRWKENLRWATRITSQIGSGFGLALIFLGLLIFIGGNVIGGMWWILIGLFLRGAAGMSYRQLQIRQALEGEQVSRFMNTDPVTVPAGTAVECLVEDYIYKYHFKMFPVLNEADKLIGCVTTHQVKALDRNQWPERSVGEITLSCSEKNSVPPDADAIKVLTKMNREGFSRLMVVKDKQLVGIITLKDLLGFLAAKIELEGED